MHSGPNIERNGLVLSLDGASRRSTLKATQVNNILPDPGNWSTGTGGQTGYSSNGSSSEQNRVLVSDDPWGRNSITWRTTPDSTSGADGGWNSSYYTIDTNYTYRFSVWVRRYTTGTGGTFYMGTNPAPIRNDNDTSQSNPYWHCPSIASLTYNQWYLVVAHCFYKDYTGGRHPESGYWYKDGSGNLVKTDLGFCNCGSEDVRWNSSTTSTQHRTYHFYTTNVNSGIEFAYPRVDKIDGKEPSISEMINKGESGWSDLINKNTKANTYNGINYSSNGKESSFTFDGTDDYLYFNTDIGIASNNQGWAAEYVFNTNSASTLQHFNSAEADDFNANWLALLSSKLAVWDHGQGVWRYGSTVFQSNTWYHITFVQESGTSMQFYVNGVAEGGDHTTHSWTSSFSALKTRYIGRYEYNGGYSRYFNGEIPIVKMYNRPLSADEVQQNYRAYKNRFNI
jgi:hypothetical protein